MTKPPLTNLSPKGFNMKPLIVTLLLSAGMLLAAPEGKMPLNSDGPAMEKHHPSAMLKQEIGLSEEQLKKLEALKIETVKAMENNRHEMELEKLSLKELALKGTLTKARVKESIKKIDDLSTKMQAARFQAANSAVDLFTDEQLKKMVDKKMMGLFFQMRETNGPEKRHSEREVENCPMKPGQCPMMDKQGRK